MPDQPGRVRAFYEVLHEALVVNGHAGYAAPQRALDALTEAGYYVACAGCNSSVSGIHYVGCKNVTGTDPT